MVSNMSKVLLAERNNLIGVSGSIRDSTLSDHLGLIINRLTATWRPGDHLLLSITAEVGGA